MPLVPSQITFRGLSHSPELDSDIRERITALERFYADIVRCRVLVEVPHRHHRDGNRVHVRIELTVPGGSAIIVSHEPSLHSSVKHLQEEKLHKDAEVAADHQHTPVAIRDAFETAARRLKDFARRHNMEAAG